MMNVSLGPKSVFRSITSKKQIKELFDRFAPSIDMDWIEREKAKDLPDALVSTLHDLREVSETEYSNIVCALQEVCDVCADRKSATRLVAAIKDADILKTFLEESHNKGKSSLQADAVWIMLHAPKVWDRLVVSANAYKIKAKTIEEFQVIPADYPENDHLDELEEDFENYLMKETLHGEHVHIEVDEDNGRYQYLVSISNFPVNVQQFDKEGQYALARDSNAINFCFDYDMNRGLLRVKCPFESKKRQVLIQLFNECLLIAKLQRIEKPSYDLSRHLEARLLPPPNSPLITSVRFCGMSITYPNQEGKLDVLSLSTEGSTPIQRNLSILLEALKVSKKSVTVSELLYEITLKSKGRSKTIQTRTTPDGFHFICRCEDEKAAVQAYLQQLVA